MKEKPCSRPGRSGGYGKMLNLAAWNIHMMCSSEEERNQGGELPSRVESYNPWVKLTIVFLIMFSILIAIELLYGSGHTDYYIWLVLWLMALVAYLVVVIPGYAEVVTQSRKNKK
ncbi:MAG: hypothetical protein JSV43_03775 [Methanobacteriota archaeon]|nr:MAG: hypothetical protein JSV43_03775 [Euryarchaeota archaeon]